MPAMSIRRAPWPAAALAAGLGLLLSACGGSSGTSPSGAAASRPATATASPSPRGSGPGSLLTGHFCADLNHLGQVEGLTAQQSDAEFDAMLDRTIQGIFEASRT